MFKNIENKLKVLAIVNFGCGIFLTICCLCWGVEKYSQIGLGVGLIVLLTATIQAWFIYAFAELLEQTKEISNTLKIGHAKDLTDFEAKRKEDERQEKEKAERQKEEMCRIEEEKKQKAEKLRQAEEAKRHQAEEERIAKIAAYWEKHPEEYKALIEKRINAETQLKKVSGLAAPQRKQLQDLIQAIDEELKKDREG